MNAVAAAKSIAAMIPVKPKTYLGGVGSTPASMDATRYYGAMMAAAVGAWQWAAQYALVDACSASPSGWIIDQDNFDFIKGVCDLDDLEAMCEPTYAWQGRHTVQT